MVPSRVKKGSVDACGSSKNKMCVSKILDWDFKPKPRKPKPKERKVEYERQSSQNVRHLTEATNAGTPQDDLAFKLMKKSAAAGNEPYAEPKLKRVFNRKKK